MPRASAPIITLRGNESTCATVAAHMGNVVSDLLKTGYLLRRPVLEDAPDAHALLTAVEMAEFGDPGDVSLDDLRDLWRRIDLTRDAWLVVAPEGDLAGYAYTRSRQVVRNDVVVYVHPAHEGCGIGTTLVRLAEARAREAVPLAPPGAEVFVTSWINARNPAACALLEREGYRAARYFWRMGVALETAPPPPIWPAGITLRTAAEIGDLRPFYNLVEAGMADHWGHVEVPFEQWMERRCGTGFDPRLWFLAEAEDAPAGAVLCRSAADAGWVDTLVVQRAHRQLGLGSALLALAFSALAQQGHPQARLIVDTANQTGATRLYERAGMHAEQEYAAYRKPLGIGG